MNLKDALSEFAGGYLVAIVIFLLLAAYGSTLD